MIELKLKCYSCDYERIISEREFIEDLQQCPSCGSDNIEIVQTGESPPERQIDPVERDRIVRRRMVKIGVIGIIFLMVGIGLYVIPWGYIFFPLIITLWVIGVILLIIAIGWGTDGQCCFACTSC